MKNLNLLIISSLILLSSCSHKIFRTISTPQYYTELTSGERDILVDKYKAASRFNRSLSIYHVDPLDVTDSTFVRLEGFAIKKSIITDLLAQPGAEGLKIEFGINGVEKHGLRRRFIFSPIISAININGVKLLNGKFYDKLPPCPECKLQ